MMWKIAFTFLAALLAVGLCQPPGGFFPADPNTPEFQKAMRFAIKQYNHDSNHLNFYGLVKVLRAQSQVVAGTNYGMTLRLGKTRCSKFSDGRNCPIIREPPQFIICDFTVYVPLPVYSANMELTESSCRI